MSPPGPGGGNNTNIHHSVSNASLSSYNSATWERTLRGSASNLVPPPLGSAPPPSTSNLSPYSNNNNNNSNARVHHSMSNLDHSNQQQSNSGLILWQDFYFLFGHILWTLITACRMGRVLNNQTCDVITECPCIIIGHQLDSQQTAPWYRNERQAPPPIKSRAPLQRQLSAGQSSLLSSHSGTSLLIHEI